MSFLQWLLNKVKNYYTNKSFALIFDPGCGVFFSTIILSIDKCQQVQSSIVDRFVCATLCDVLFVGTLVEKNV